MSKHNFFGPWAKKFHVHLLFLKYFLKMRIIFFTNHDVFGPWVNKFCTHLPKKTSNLFSICTLKNPTNHGLVGPWANELHAHLQKQIEKKSSQNICRPILVF
jgi:hypothetical protein